MLWGGAFLHNIQETVTFTNLHVIGFVEFYALLDANNNVVLEFIFSAL
jgi:hypothetical protein